MSRGRKVVGWKGRGKDGSVSVLVQKRQLDSRITDDLRYSRADALRHAWDGLIIGSNIGWLLQCDPSIVTMLYENGLNCLLIAR